MSETDTTPQEPASPCIGGVPCSFAHFLVTLGSSALVHLGETDVPGADKVERDLKLAAHTINVLNVLKRKTAGNLDDDESRLLDALIGELSQKYQAVSAA